MQHLCNAGTSHEGTRHDSGHPTTACYHAGLFDQALLAVLRHYDEILQVMLPSFGPERRSTYSPFLPVSPNTGKVLQVPILEHDAEAGTVVFRDEDGTKVETLVTGGHCKLPWKCDWAMHWATFGVDYEMAGKDLLDSVRLSSQICRILGGTPPHTLIYEMFLDEHGAKISKSKGNGIAVEEWLRYAPTDLGSQPQPLPWVDWRALTAVTSATHRPRHGWRCRP